MKHTSFRPTSRWVVVALLAAYLYLLTQDAFLFHHFRQGARDYAQLAAYVLIIGVCYLNYYVLAPRFLFQKQYATYALIALGFLVLLLVPDFFAAPPPHAPHPPGPPPENDPPMRIPLAHLSNKLFFYAAGLFATSFLRVNGRWQQTEKARLTAELHALKAQINPHFLFNTLNNIYACALAENAPTTADAMLKLSGLMRYTMRETPGQRTPLPEEMTYLEEYIALQRLRLGPATALRYETTGTAEGLFIAPMILVPFLENAFKYGVNPDVPSEIHIRVEISGKVLALWVQNSKVARSFPFESTGYGLQNTRKRLQTLYPGRHRLAITETETDYQVHLTLQLL